MYEDLFNYENNANVDVNEISSQDLESLRLLTTQHKADIVSLYSDILAYITTYESANAIYRKYDNKPNTEQNPDVTGIEALSLGMVARIIYSDIAFTKYDLVVNNLMETGEEQYIVKKDAYKDISMGNVLRTAGTLMALRGAGKLYELDSQLPIFGV